MNWTFDGKEWNRETEDHLVVIQKVISDETFYRYYVMCNLSTKLIKTSGKFYSLTEAMDDADREYS